MSNCAINTFEEFKTLSEKERGEFFGSDSGKLLSVIFAQQFNTDFLRYIFKLAAVIREISITKRGRDHLRTLCSDRVAELFFRQSSTRTRNSFQVACLKLGMQIVLNGDEAAESTSKGESELDMAHTLGIYSDLMILRHPEPGFVEEAAWHLARTGEKIPVINAGSSQDQHPTQALLDAFTMFEHFQQYDGFSGKTITFVGDLRSRTVRSNVYLLRNFPGITFQFCAPENHQIEKDIISFLEKHEIQYRICNQFGRPEITCSDVIYMTRLQNDYDRNDPDRTNRVIEGFVFGLTQLEWLRHDAIIMHPLPRRGELDVKCDKDPRIKIWKQTKNGLWIRMALLTIIFGQDNVLKNDVNFASMFIR